MNKNFRYHIDVLTVVTDQDYKEILRLLRELHSKYVFYIDIERIKGIIDAPNKMIFVAKGATEDSTEDHIVGLILCSICETLSLKKIILSDLVVCEQHRNKGVARLLFKRAFDFGKHINGDVLELLVRRNNATAIALYETFEFDKPDYMYMRKILKRWTKKEIENG